MAISDPMTKVNLDASTDNPQTARSELAGNIDIYNAMVAALGNIVELDAGNGLENDGGGNLRVKTPASSGINVVAAGINVLTDTGLIVNATGVALDVNALTEDASPDIVNDFALVYDVSAAAEKKVKLSNITGSPAMVLLDSKTASASSSIDFFSFIDSTYKYYLFKWNEVILSVNSARLQSRVRIGAAVKSGASDYSTTLDGLGGGLFGTKDLANSSSMEVIGQPAGATTIQRGRGNLELSFDGQSIVGNYWARTSGSLNMAGVFGGHYKGTPGTMDGFQFIPSGGTITSGTFEMWGVKG